MSTLYDMLDAVYRSPRTPTYFSNERDAFMAGAEVALGLAADAADARATGYAKECNNYMDAEDRGWIAGLYENAADIRALAQEIKMKSA